MALNFEFLGFLSDLEEYSMRNVRENWSWTSDFGVLPQQKETYTKLPAV